MAKAKPKSGATKDKAKAAAKTKSKPTAAKPTRAAKGPPPLFFVTEDNDKLGSKTLKPGRFQPSGPADSTHALTADDIGYWWLTSSNGRYLQRIKLWPVRLLPETKLAQEEPWSGYRASVVEVEPPLPLDGTEAWQRLLDAGMRLKPRRKRDNSALSWPALKGFVEPLRLLLDAGAQIGDDDPLTAAAAFQQRATTELLASRGFDVAKSIKVMERYNNEGALAILRSLKS